MYYLAITVRSLIVYPRLFPSVEAAREFLDDNPAFAGFDPVPVNLVKDWDDEKLFIELRRTSS